MVKKLLYGLSLITILGLSTTGFSQSTILYAGYYYSTDLVLIDTAGGTYDIIETRTLTTDFADDVDGCYGLSLNPNTGEMYILYQVDDGDASNRRLGTLDTASAAITDIGSIGNMTDIAFRNSNLYAVSGSYSGHGIYEIDPTDASATLMLNPSSDNEAGAIVNNFYSNELYFIDEDHFTVIDVITNTETVDPGFGSFEEECMAMTMLNDSVALVSNYDELYEFNINTLTTSFVFDAGTHMHGMAFGMYPLIVKVDGPTTFCSSDISELTVSEEGSSYQWYFEGAEIVGATEMNYLPTESGEYYCIVDGEATKNTVTLVVIPAPEVTFTATPNPVFLGDDPTGTVDFENTTAIGDEFMWDFDNGFTTTLENPSFAFAMAGTYNVTLWVTDLETGCVGSTTVIVEVIEGVGISVNSNDFSVYPTVSSDLVNLKYSGFAEDLNAELLDLSGKTIETRAVQPNSTVSFNLFSLEKGTYLIRVTGQDNSSEIFRVVKN
jgi:PKD repeat protein